METKLNGITFFPIKEFTSGDVAFGADISNYFHRSNLPDVPKKYTEMASNLFFNGGKLPRFHEKVNLNDASRALRALLGSFEPPHESKIATVGYALWVWCEGDLCDQE